VNGCALDRQSVVTLATNTVLTAEDFAATLDACDKWEQELPF